MLMLRKMVYCFRPLTGPTISQFWEGEGSDPFECFRPLTGPTISQSKAERDLVMIETGFRPLTGPTISQSKVKNSILAYIKEVSVPLRGLLFLNQRTSFPHIQTAGVSVPLRGLLFLNVCNYALNHIPYGFRPLTGPTISQSGNG